MKATILNDTIVLTAENHTDSKLVRWLDNNTSHKKDVSFCARIKNGILFCTVKRDNSDAI